MLIFSVRYRKQKGMRERERKKTKGNENEKEYKTIERMSQGEPDNA